MRFAAILAKAGTKFYRQLQDFWTPASARVTTFCEPIKRTAVSGLQVGPFSFFPQFPIQGKQKKTDGYCHEDSA